MMNPLEAVPKNASRTMRGVLLLLLLLLCPFWKRA